MSVSSKAVKSFQRLSFLNQTHGCVMRALLAAMAFELTLVFGQGIALARHAASAFWNDDFVGGAHLLSWHLHNGWLGRFMRHTPRFNFADALDDQTRAIAERKISARIAKNWTAYWGHSLHRDRHALLYLLARRIHVATDAETRVAQVAEYAALATEICQTIPTDLGAGDPLAVKKNLFSLIDARATLLALKSLCDGADMPWYLVSGTFLGAVREGDFLSHDYDIDIGINIEDFDHARFVAAVQGTDDLTLVNTNPYIHLVPHADGTATQDIRPALYRVLHMSGIEVDVFIHHKDGNQRWHGSSIHRWSNSDFTLTEYEISGITVLGPADADRYLTENYGNWRVPVKVFNCSTGTPNVSFTQNLNAVAQMLRVAGAAPMTSVDGQIARLVLTQEGYMTLQNGRWSFQVPWLDGICA